MASYSKTNIFFSLIITISITIPTSIGHRERWRRSDEREREEYLRDLCSKTSRSDECWRIIKPELQRLDNSDDRTIIGAVMDLAITKSNEIHDRLNQLYSDSRNNELKEKYIACSKNYNDVNRNLVVARRDLDSNNRLNIPVQVKDAEEELNNCTRQFENDSSLFDPAHIRDWLFGKESFDPAHIGDRNNELGLYLEIVGVAIENFENDSHN